MNNTYFNKNSLTIITFILLSVFQLGCNAQPTTQMESKNLSPEMAEKLHFYRLSYKDMLELPDNPSTAGKGEIVRLDILPDASIDWTKYNHRKESDTTSVTSFSLYSDEYVYSLDEKIKGRPVQYLSKWEATFYQYNPETSQMFYMLAIENLSASNDKSCIDALHYKQIPETFNGHLLYFSFKKDFISGITMQNGKVIGRIAKIKNRLVNEITHHTLTKDGAEYDLFREGSDQKPVYLGTLLVKSDSTSQDTEVKLVKIPRGAFLNDEYAPPMPIIKIVPTIKKVNK